MISDIRVGLGHDIHAFEKGRELWLGGVKIDYEMGLKGHSDADALVHAIMDAMLGALALGDIGQHFPDTDPQYEGISSMKLLKKVVELTQSKGYKVGNLDCMIHCEKPKLLPYKPTMIKNLSEVLGISEDRISVKAGTNEKMDSVGEGRSIECDAVVLMIKE
ncbi:MAG: 2-C-methyl-D-erythritol 2,4-cyclodiphosphate synthase [Candidatus Riflebacteria bacterium]|nr:2-C-methyl-D-erythritol 2,4-cyclodiphosphate synthase [Candidatus Riflebacteria bacterium]